MSMFKPFDYQHGMVDHLRDTPHAALFAGMEEWLTHPCKMLSCLQHLLQDVKALLKLLPHSIRASCKTLFISDWVGLFIL